MLRETEEARVANGNLGVKLRKCGFCEIEVSGAMCTDLEIFVTMI